MRILETAGELKCCFQVQKCSSSCKLVIVLFVSNCHCFGARSIVSVVFFYCSLKGYQAIHMRPYESCYLTL